MSDKESSEPPRRITRVLMKLPKGVLKTITDVLDTHERQRARFAKWIGGGVFEALNRSERVSRRGGPFLRIKEYFDLAHYNKTHSNRRAYSSQKHLRSADDIRTIFLGVFYFRFWAYFELILFLSIILTVDLLLTCSVTPPGSSIYGLLLNFLGGLIIARAVFRGYAGHLLMGRDASSTAAYEILDPLSEEPVELDFPRVFTTSQAAVNAVFGGFFLTVGFVSQVIVTLGYTYHAGWLPCF